MKIRGTKRGKTIQLIEDIDVPDGTEIEVKSFKSQLFNFRKIFSLAVTVIGAAYLLLVLSGKVNKDRLGQTELVIFITLALINSELFERLSKFQVGQGGVTFELEKKVADVQKKQGEIEGTQALQQKEIEEIARFLIGGFLDKNELRHLQILASDLPLSYTEKKDYHETEFRRLRNLGLIESASGGFFTIASLPVSTSDLKTHIRITALGIKYLELVNAVKNKQDNHTVSSED